MRTLELSGGFSPANLSIVERERPKPGPGQVLVRVVAVSLNYRDHLFVSGKYDPRAALPAVPASDCAGIVEETGKGVSRFRQGDRVINLFMEDWPSGPARREFLEGSRGAGGKPGVLSEYVVFDAAALLPVPAQLSLKEAACLPCAGLTAWCALFAGGAMKPGATVVIQGTGGVALFALQFARMAGARTALLSSSDEKLAQVSDLGADVSINYLREPDWSKSARAALAADGVDLVVELGGEKTLAQSLRAVRVGGTLAMIGVLSGPVAPLPLPLVVMRQIRLQGVTVGSRTDMEAMLAAIATHGLRPRIHQVFPFEAHAAAFDMLGRGGHVGKIVISLGS
ncbi:NADPH:quinone reductase-like Zn-dependent oxidoreductase [Breoghania corrubedonensis]|uniref:NADPH:quinone reductase-like Zn-dependent oxidoreductase n=1 Tax=Breoghania corrubedonensis TaxID=665038 RepID=A0A2T5VF94_9HYPH|nr:NAD(P)-dependent alcohol dehydrogenase [Breoghania corrubedonensis]PTW62435.1 NADPH:quinone reductase-like Zn-dependent oxidoreductase [Breoghania corrubedonensis]